MIIMTKRSFYFIFAWGLALIFAGFLFKYSAYLAAMRIYQVDECENVFIARVLATGQMAHYFSFVSPLEFALMWLARGATRSADLFASARCLMLIIFWINLLLIALATGERLFSRRFPIVLVAAITLAPLWDYGFEIREDNLLLTGLLLFWCVTRNAPAKPQSCLAAGAITVALQFTAFKALVYTIPLSFLILFFPVANQIPRWKLILYWLAGVTGMFLLFRLVYGATGLWPLFLSDTHRVFADATGDNRFAPWATLQRLLVQTPLLLALLLAGIITVAMDLRRRGRAALAWDGWLPEAFLFAVAFAALMINPTPFAYNLLNLVPFIFLFAYRYTILYSQEVWKASFARPLIVSVLIFAHLVPFGIATSRHLNWPNYRQQELMRLAEALTDPAKDPVYDGIGMVPTRPSINFHWLLHSLNIQNFKSGKWPSVREMLAAKPAAVIITSYRTDWLSEQDHEFISNRYVAVSDDFWVLGKVLPKGGGTFEIYHTGRYRIATLKGSDLAGTYPAGINGFFAPEIKGTVKGTLDGVPLTNSPVELTVGTHRIKCAPDCQPTVVWVGPKLNRIGRHGQGDHRRLFVNWY
jgi:hypothetical protein